MIKFRSFIVQVNRPGYSMSDVHTRMLSKTEKAETVSLADGWRRSTRGAEQRAKAAEKRKVCLWILAMIGNEWLVQHDCKL